MSSLTPHVDEVEFCDPNIRIHVEQFIKLSHLEEQDNIVILTLQLPPLSLCWSLLGKKVWRNVDSPWIEVWMILGILVTVSDVLWFEEG